MENVKFIYLEFGDSIIRRRELRYSIRTLLAECPSASQNILIYTDNPSHYASDAQHIKAMDIAPQRRELLGTYPFRAKPCILLQALRANACPCVLLDTDTFVQPGFRDALKQKLAQGAVMNSFVRRNPYPGSVGFTVDLPNSGTYRYDPAASHMYNSGLVAAYPSHAPVIEDAIALMDALRPLTAELTHDQEQFAIAEAFRIHGVHLDVIDVELVHYCPRWSKRYMDWRFERSPELDAAVVPARPHITLNKSAARAFKMASRTRRFLVALTLPRAPSP